MLSCIIDINEYENNVYEKKCTNHNGGCNVSVDK